MPRGPDPLQSASQATATLTFDEHGDGIGNAWTVIREHANRSGPDARVVTCPEWRIRDLVAHQGMVHRWATAILRGQQADSAALEAEGLAAVDQLELVLDDGARRGPGAGGRAR